MGHSSSKKVLIIARQYKNWPSVLFKLTVKRPVRALKLRDGRTISSSSPGGVHCSSQLAQLLYENWEVIDADDRFILLSRPSGMKFKCRYTTGYDFGHLAELFIEQTYGARFDGKTVIDVGMSNGDSSIYFAEKGAKKVVGVEPFHESYSLAVENIEANSLAEVIQPLNLALSAEKGKSSFLNSSDDPNANSMSPSEFVSSIASFDSTSVVDTTTLDELVSKHCDDQVDLLKMDCEGCEYSVFRAIKPETLRHIKEIRLEFHNGGREIAGILSSAGFEVECEDDSLGYLHAVRTA